MTNTDFSLFIADEAAMLDFGACLADVIHPGIILFLYGKLGAGKTTLMRGLLRQLGVVGKVKSPTYTLVEPYEVNDYQVYHFDLYRLQDARELTHMGIEEYVSPAAICLIEWPEHGLPYLPQPDLSCYIDYEKEGRVVQLKPHTAAGEQIVNQL